MSEKNCGNCKHFMPQPTNPYCGCCGNPSLDEMAVYDGVYIYATVDGGCGEHWEPQTNYQRYFGTPEKAARVLQEWCYAKEDCSECPFLALEPCPWQANSMSSWLESEAE